MTSRRRNYFARSEREDGMWEGTRENRMLHWYDAGAAWKRVGAERERVREL